MSKVAIKLSTLTDIGDAVRDKKGMAEKIPVAKIASEIRSIQGGTDTSDDTVTAESMLEGVTAHNASGEPIVGVIPLYDGAVTGGLSVMANASKYLYGKEVTEYPVCYLYGEIPVPEAPIQWDKQKYPYAYMNYLTTILEDGRVAKSWNFVAGEQPALAKKTDNYYHPYSPSKCVVMFMANQAYFDLLGQSDKYVEGWQIAEKDSTNSIYLGNIYWANHDVKCNDSENILISAGVEPTEPTPNGGFYIINGVAYEGFVLPNIDTVCDKETYPYAMLNFAWDLLGDGSVVLVGGYVSEGEFHNETYSNLYSSGRNMKIACASCNKLPSMFNSMEELEAELGGPVNTWFVEEQDDSTDQKTYLGCLWTSHDIYRDDGTLYMKATEPIPIYE